MRIVGIVAEYNPFHNGHCYHLEKTKEITKADVVVAVMSGSFTQRCEPAVISKWARAKTALLNGVDLVLELPFSFSTASAESFALGGVSVLHSLGCVDAISFGSECGDIAKLIEVKNAVMSEETQNALKEHLKSGVTFATARAKAVEDGFGEEIADLMYEPNNILAVEYLKALDYLQSDIEPFTIQRMGTGYHQEGIKGSFSSASHIRKLITDGNNKIKRVMPESTYAVLREEILKGASPASIFRLERGILSKLRTMGKEEIANINEVAEGLEGRIFNAAMKARSLEELFLFAKTKRYTMSRIRRVALWSYLGVQKRHISDEVPYIRVLGFNDKGRQVIKMAKKADNYPIITKAADAKEELSWQAEEIFDLESRATDVWALCTPAILSGGLDFVNSPVYLK